MSNKPADEPARRDLDQRLDSWMLSKVRAEVSLGTEKRILDILGPDLRPVKPLPSQRVLVLMFLGVFAACTVVILPMIDRVGLRLMTAPQIAGMAVALAVGVILFSVTLVRQMVPGSAARLPLAIVLVLCAAAFGSEVAVLFPWREPVRFVSEGLPCAAMEVAVAIPGAILFWLIARRGSLFAGAKLGVALGGLAALLGLTIVQFQCMYPQAPHLLVWHGGVAVAVIASSALLGRWSSRVRTHR